MAETLAAPSARRCLSARLPLAIRCRTDLRSHQVRNLGESMRKAALFVGGLMLSALACAPAMAEVVRVKITARVTQLADFGQFEGKIVVGQRLSGTYVYNTDTPNQSDDPSYGQYHTYPNEARVRFVSGGLVFESAQPQHITINVAPPASSVGEFSIDSSENKPLSNGTSIEDIDVTFRGVGALTQSTALPTGLPDLIDYPDSEVMISGGGSAYFVRAQIESVEAVVPDVFKVSPATGSFVPGQQFDAALLLPRNSNVVSAQATANGAPLPLAYPGSCTLLPPNSVGKPALLCPDAHAVLSLAAGAPIEWTVELANGGTLTKTVTWTLAQ